MAGFLVAGVQRSEPSWATRLAGVSGPWLLAASLLVLAPACGKKVQDTVPAPSGSAGSGAATPTVAGPAHAATPAAGPAADDAQRSKLAKDFATVRCQVIGYAAPRPQLYEELGWGSAARFTEAFEAAAKADPVWARQAVQQAYDQACPGGKPSPLAQEPTPAAAPAPSDGAP